MFEGRCDYNENEEMHDSKDKIIRVSVIAYNISSYIKLLQPYSPFL